MKTRLYKATAAGRLTPALDYMEEEKLPEGEGMLGMFPPLGGIYPSPQAGYIPAKPEDLGFFCYFDETS